MRGKIDILKGLGNSLFDRQGLLSLWEDIAQNFFPERAGFTSGFTLDDSIGQSLNSSSPVLIRRELGNAIGSMARPTNKEWFHHRTKWDWDDIGPDGRAWLEKTDRTMRRVMYHRASGLSVAASQADQDYAAFGQCVIEVVPTPNANGILYRNHHLKDVAWMDDLYGNASTVFRKWEPTVFQAYQLFGDKLHKDVIKDFHDNKVNKKCNFWHVCLPAGLFDALDSKGLPYVSVWLDVANDHIIEEVGSKRQKYLIPRWGRISGTQYAVSPATIVALPDARMLQAMVGTLLEAGEKAVNPPMAANAEIFGGEIGIYPGGISWAETANGRLSDHLMQLPTDKNGIPFGMEMIAKIEAGLTEAFYLNKLSLPPMGGPDMTAYEVGQRVQEYIRNALPLFEPLEADYNGQLCELTFELLFDMNAFGSPLDIPGELQGAQTSFVFESPLHDALETEKAQKFMEMKGLAREALEVDPGAMYTIDFNEAFRDALLGTGVPASWLRSQAESDQMRMAAEQAQTEQQQLMIAQQQADVEKTLSQAEIGDPNAA